MKKYDTIIIGSGPGGMATALYTSRSNMSVLMLDKGLYGGQMNNTAYIENYLGFNKISGLELSENMYQSAMQFGTDYKYGNVKHIEKDSNGLWIVETDIEKYITNSIIIATGSTSKKLNITGENEYQSKGVSYCAICDANFFKDKNIVVVGGGDSAVEESIYLANIVKHVTVLHRKSTLTAQKILQEKLFEKNNVDIKYNTVVNKINGDGNKITSITYNTNKTMIIDGIFIYIGNNPLSEIVQGLNICNENGWINTNTKMETKISGLYAIGDVRNKNIRQIGTAISDGIIAAQNVSLYNENIEKK